MKRFSGNLLVQFSVTSLVIMVALALVLSMVLTSRLNRNVDLLRDHSAAMMSGAMISPEAPHSIISLTNDVNTLRRIVYGGVGGAFILLYVGLVSVVWRGWKSIVRNESALLDANEDLSRANEELRETRSRLVRSERLAAIGELAAGVAHELRNPLGAINNSIYYVRAKLNNTSVVEENPRIAQYLEIIEEEIQSSNEIITDLMLYARVNPPSLSATKLESVVDDAVSRAGLSENILVSRTFATNDIEISADREQIRRVLMNLIKNAGEAMPEGGTLSINADVVGEFVELNVSDTGIGVEPDDLGKLFEPLFTTKAKGIGLGLAIVGELVSRHKGTIEVSSQLGRGTTFTLRLPVSSHVELPLPSLVG